MHVLFVNLDAIRRTKSGLKYINVPFDQEPIPRSANVLQSYANQGFSIYGISNQGGIECGYKTLDSAFKEMQVTLNIFPQINSILFSPLINGTVCWVVSRSSPPRGFTWIPNTSQPMWVNGQWVFPNQLFAYGVVGEPRVRNFRKSSSGMIDLVLSQRGIPYHQDSLMIGNCDGDAYCANSRGVTFIPAYSLLGVGE